MRLKVEYVYNPIDNNTLVLVWDYMQIIQSITEVGEIPLEDRDKYSKKLLRKIKYSKEIDVK